MSAKSLPRPHGSPSSWYKFYLGLSFLQRMQTSQAVSQQNRKWPTQNHVHSFDIWQIDEHILFGSIPPIRNSQSDLTHWHTNNIVARAYLRREGGWRGRPRGPLDRRRRSCFLHAFLAIWIPLWTNVKPTVIDEGAATTGPLLGAGNTLCMVNQNIVASLNLKCRS